VTIPRPLRPALAALAVTALFRLMACGSATYNEGDTSDTTRPNQCGEANDPQCEP
jgi:hypothetical protein